MVAIQRILADRWDGVMNHEEIVERPTSEEFDRLLNRLDGRAHTMIVIEGEGDCHMSIGGGDGSYVVYATFNNDVFWNLLAADIATGMILVNAGGQEGDYPARQVVGIERARQAGLTFLETGQVDPALPWEKA